MRRARADDGWVARRLAGALAALVLLALAACTRLPPEPLRIGVSPWVGYDPVVLAAVGGGLDARQARVIEMDSNEGVMQALEAGVIDGAAMTLDAAVVMRRQGAPIAVVALLSESRGADALMVGPDVRDLADLRGRRVALSSITAGSLVLDTALARAGLGRGDVVLQELPAVDHGLALAEGRTDAVVTFEPFLSQLRQAGWREVFSTRDAPGLVIDVLVLREDALAARGDAVAALLQAIDPELRRFADPDDPALPAGRLSLGLDLGERAYRDTLRGIHFLPLDESRRLFADPGAEGYASWLARTGAHLGPAPEAPALAVAGPLAPAPSGPAP